ncbi:GNAT superfamily N-acetyltransferase [Phenylobacterium haematophilum]|uniref:GNAT superfamily N-acetyltransferase n=1 Tax=Phenylobacterium haematophilum TaxID=98513 RepID=A0A839ZWD2_9CAUL|nr:GNAT superfamily N-acetyltransferase [Phenylobacterium haematophilum]
MILRRAALADAGQVARLQRHVMRVSLPYLPDLHTPEEDLRFFSERLFPENEVWVAEADGQIIGYVAFKPGWVSHLYVHPDHQAQGIGPKLLAKALEDGAPRELWTFQQNDRARRFYEARGFELIRLTDGADNEEKTPDALYRWAGR